MAQFDVYRLIDGRIVVDCQSDAVDAFSTRFVVPLQPYSQDAVLTRRLHPRLILDGEEYVPLTQLGAALRKRELHNKIGSVDEYEYEIKAALDMLFTGF